MNNNYFKLCCVAYLLFSVSNIISNQFRYNEIFFFSSKKEEMMALDVVDGNCQQSIRQSRSYSGDATPKEEGRLQSPENDQDMRLDPIACCWHSACKCSDRQLYYNLLHYCIHSDSDMQCATFSEPVQAGASFYRSLNPSPKLFFILL